MKRPSAARHGGNRVRKQTSIVYLACVALLLSGVAVAVYAAGTRSLQVDAGPTVALMLDFNRLERVSFLEGEPIEEIVEQLLAAGVDGFVVRDRTLAELQTLGRVRVAWGWELAGEARLAGQVPTTSLPSLNVYIHAPDPALHEWLHERLRQRWVHGVPERVEVEGSDWIRVPVPLSDLSAVNRPQLPLYADDYNGPYPRDLMMLPLGIEGAVVEQVVQWGGQVGVEVNAAQLPAGSGVEWAQGLDVLPPGAIVIFREGVAPRSPGGYAAIARQFQERGWRLGLVWANTSPSLQQTAGQLPGSLVKVHPMWPGEPVPAIVGGVAERLERMVYYQRFVTLQTESAASAAPPVIAEVKGSLAAAGYETGSPQSLRAPGLPALWRSGALLAVVGALALAAGLSLDSIGARAAGRMVMTLCLVMGLAGVALSVRTGVSESGWQVAAFLVAAAMPVLAVVLVDRLATGRSEIALSPLVAGLVALALATGITAAGGLVVQALLGTELYTAQLLQFRGVRPALLLPPIWVSLLLAGSRSGAMDAIIGLLDRPIRWGHVAGLALGLVILGLVSMRSGNFPLLPVPELELSLRNWLDASLGVRPRTKEFLFGHPLLLLAVAGLVRARRRGGEIWRWLLPLATIGQASVVNTFAHLHTPLGISLFRTWNGLWLGAMIGTAMWFLFLLAGAVARDWGAVSPVPAAGSRQSTGGAG